MTLMVAAQCPPQHIICQIQLPSQSQEVCMNVQDDCAAAPSSDGTASGKPYSFLERFLSSARRGRGDGRVTPGTVLFAAFLFFSLRLRTAEALRRDREGQIEHIEKRGGNVCIRTNISARLRRETIGFPVEFERNPRFSCCVRSLSFRERRTAFAVRSAGNVITNVTTRTVLNVT